MSNILDVPFSGGYVSTGDAAKSAYDLAPGELVSMAGAFYRKNDASQPFKMPGRALFGSAGSTVVKGMAICQFDEGGTDKLVVSIGTTLVSAVPGATGTFSTLTTGLNSSATRLTACHQNDRWYLGNGYNKNLCLKPNGTVRDMGMASPPISLVATVSSSSGSTAAPVTVSGSFTNPTFVYDGNAATYASGTLTGDSAATITHTWGGWAAAATSPRFLNVSWSLAGLPIASDVDRTGGIGTGGALDAGYQVTVLLEKSENGGTSFSTILTTTRTFSTAVSTVTASVTADSSQVQFRATLTYLSGVVAATLRIYTVDIQIGSTTPAFTTTETMYYTYTEYDALDLNEGPPAEFTVIPAFTLKNMIQLDRAAATNAAATHWNVYRSVPGAAKSIDSMGLVKSIPIADTTFYDTFVVDRDTQLETLIPAMIIGDLSIPRDTPPPAFISMVSWKGSICGISRTNRRAWRYSEAGRPESFPEFYVVTSFPIDEHDGLIGQMPVGETMVLLCEGAALALDDTPRVVDGQFNGANARPLKGHPGCVGTYALTPFSVAGEPRGAWVSPYGVYVTNGTVCACISTELAWESEVNVPFLGSSVLRWDAKNLILWFEFDLNGDGRNDREMPFHMAQAHSKGEAMPKLGQPTAKATSCMASALIGATHYRFSGHPSNGAVYVEESGYQDAATGSNVAMVIKTGKITNKKADFAVIKATVLHGDFGLGETATLTTTGYRDAARETDAVVSTVNVYGHRGTTVAVARNAEAFDFQIAYSGVGSGGILGIQAEVEGQGRSGSAPRWASVSVTP